MGSKAGCFSSMGNGLWLLQDGLSWQFNTMECDGYGIVDRGCGDPVLWQRGQSLRLSGGVGCWCLALWEVVGCCGQWLPGSVDGGCGCWALWKCCVQGHRCWEQTDTESIYCQWQRLCCCLVWCGLRFHGSKVWGPCRGTGGCRILAGRRRLPRCWG